MPSRDSLSEAIDTFIGGAEWDVDHDTEARREIPEETLADRVMRELPWRLAQMDRRKSSL